MGISLFFWFAISYSEETDKTFTIAFRVEGQPASMVFTTYIPADLKVTIHDERYRIVDYNFHQSLDSLVVDFSHYADALGNFRLSGAELKALVQSKLKTTTQLTAVSPATIDARFAVTEGKRLPIIFEGDYTPAANYRCRPARLSTDSVLIHAPSAILDTLTGIHTTRFYQRAMTDTLTTHIGFDLPIGVKATPNTIKVTIPVSEYVERVFTRVPITVVDVPVGKRLQIFPATAQVTCLVDFAAYHHVRSEQFALSVSYDSIRSRQQQHLGIDLDYDDPTDAISHVRVMPDSVDFLIERE